VSTESQNQFEDLCKFKVYWDLGFWILSLKKKIEVKIFK